MANGHCGEKPERIGQYHCLSALSMMLEVITVNICARMQFSSVFEFEKKE